MIIAGQPCYIQTETLPTATAGTPYNAALQAAPGCTGSQQWQVSQCSLPPGLSLDPGTGIISGLPQMSGTYAFQVTLTTTQGASTRNLALNVGAGSPADYDNDGDVDLEDFHVFALGYTGTVGTRPFCGKADFASTDTPLNIPDGGSASSTITLPPGITVADVNVQVDVRHGEQVDLKLTLTSPGGTTVLLKDFGADSGPYVPRTYDDHGFPPAQPLSVLNGQSGSGNWVLTAYDFDTVYIDNPVLNSWKLIITGQ